ncbi:MAG: penicillin-binding protein [Candidatus Yanofskybacteria bacterium CG10_big_fil_rev_8_21_14_0_10_36_16]|uniref:Penicillin-binding protein n=1 Tax=Candidatus Yanofskybacteria bacterium CG10_big_fil_rev_8_21_14_0_10_36_16 TaxID=1975096 RepID=A0A2J0Q6G6_9BACT|nr:MAG: penicillin-binding protein [Candidatus Yanofskybacteria bacterium CG10_big_fil_rev_8_21_14_0_10_36_16]
MHKKENMKTIWLKRTFIVLFSLFVLGLALSVSVFLYYSRQIPDPNVISSRRISESTKIYAQDGETLLYNIHGEEKRTIIPWEEISDDVKNATLVAEDADFYTHKGLDIRGILRAFYKNIVGLEVSQGGSTITQQLIKNSLLSNERVLSRKIKEAVLSVEIERRFSKDEIFWMYLNQIPYGSNAYGIEAASQTFFDKTANELTLSEAALLAALPNAPSYYSPYGNHYPELIARRDFILESMLRNNYINQDEFREAVEEQPSFQPPRDIIVAPHFVIMVREYLTRKYGEDIVQNGGLQVVTTLDHKLQSLAEDVISKHADDIKTRFNAGNAALTAVDPRTGKILAMVGSKDYFDVINEGNFNVATALRQPGSAFKPFAYMTAVEKGFTDSTIVFDLLTEFNPECEPGAFQEKDRYGIDCYHPKNYSGVFKGPVTLRQSLAQSLNIPSVKILHLAGINKTIENAKKMGITSLTEPERYGLSLVLGGAEVRLVDIVSAYGVLANDGIKNPTTFIQKVTTSDGVILEEYRKNEDRVIDKKVTRLMNDIMSDNLSRAPVFGFNNYLNLGERPVAAKTGTTQENRDAWLIGYTPSLVAGVWSGNNDNSKMSGTAAGASVAGLIWNDFMRKALEGTPIEQFPDPDPSTSSKTMLNGRYVGENGVHNILYYVDKNDPQGPIPSNPYTDPQYENWESSVARWASNVFNTPSLIPSPSPTQ